MRFISLLRRRDVTYGLTLLIAIAIAVVTLLPPDSMVVDAPGSDKVHHLFAFAILVFPMAARNPRSAYWAIPAAVLYGSLIEVIQPYFGRNFDVGDILADGAGALAGSLMGWGAHVLFLSRQTGRATGRGDRTS